MNRPLIIALIAISAPGLSTPGKRKRGRGSSDAKQKENSFHWIIPKVTKENPRIPRKENHGKQSAFSSSRQLKPVYVTGRCSHGTEGIYRTWQRNLFSHVTGPSGLSSQPMPHRATYMQPSSSEYKVGSSQDYTSDNFRVGYMHEAMQRSRDKLLEIAKAWAGRNSEELHDVHEVAKHISNELMWLIWNLSGEDFAKQEGLEKWRAENNFAKHEDLRKWQAAASMQVLPGESVETWHPKAISSRQPKVNEYYIDAFQMVEQRLRTGYRFEEKRPEWIHSSSTVIRDLQQDLGRWKNTIAHILKNEHYHDLGDELCLVLSLSAHFLKWALDVQNYRGDGADILRTKIAISENHWMHGALLDILSHNAAQEFMLYTPPNY